MEINIQKGNIMNNIWIFEKYVYGRQKNRATKASNIYRVLNSKIFGKR